MLPDPSVKYRPAACVDLPDRQWPSRVITRAPIWASTDLRDGNQALFEPMSIERKLRLFRLLCAIGFREIEIAFPSASQIEFDFVRRLIEGGHIPEDVTIGLLTPAREPLIERTLQAASGARRVIIHVYTATSARFRQVVFGASPAEMIDLTVGAVHQVRAGFERAAVAASPLGWRLQYSPETFSATELPFALQICDAVTAAWEASPDRPVIINLPATVEVAGPNVFADQIEWMHRRLARREGIVLSVHPHNDRGCAVAAAELAQLAGAQRVEGCLFGNGERTGNVDLVTLALNLYTQGISPGLDFSEIERIARVTEECTRMPIHPRHPYAGDLVYTAFSGSHQDAIRKGMAAQRAADHWQVPYLPIDPQDLGRDYRALVRINSQSGKGGIAFLLERSQGLSLPRRLQIEFAAAVQRTAETLGTEIDADQLWELFAAEYLQAPGPLRLLEHHCANTETPAEYGASAPTTLCAAVEVEGRALALTGQGNGPIAAFVHALRLPLELRSYEEHALGEGAMARAAAFVEMSLPGVSGSRFGVGLHENIVTAALKAVCSAANRLLAADRSGSVGISQRPLHPLAQ